MKRLLGLLVAAVMMAGGPAACSGSVKAGTCLSSFDVVTSSSVAAGPHAVPDMSIGCLDGSGDVTIPALSRPMIISFWAVYCQPCRTELPALGAFANAAAGRVAVIGVDTDDVRSMSRSMASGLDLTFPMLFDPDGRLFKAVSAPGMPTLLFVAPGGTIAYSSSSGTVDGADLTLLTTKYLGVTIG